MFSLPPKSSSIFLHHLQILPSFHSPYTYIFFFIIFVRTTYIYILIYTFIYVKYFCVVFLNKILTLFLCTLFNKLPRITGNHFLIYPGFSGSKMYLPDSDCHVKSCSAYIRPSPHGAFSGKIRTEYTAFLISKK